MRTLVATTLFVYLASGVFAQQPPRTQETDTPERITFINQHVHRVESLRNAGDYQAAECALREWLASETAGTRTYTMIQDALGDLLREEGRNAEARELFNEVLRSPAATAEYRITALLGLADVDLHLGDFRTSIEEWNSALDLARTEQYAVLQADALRGLGASWLQSGSPARAEPLLRRSVKMLEDDNSAPLELAASLSALANLYQAEHKPSLAEAEWSRALEIDRKVLGDNHPQTAFLMEMLGEVYSERGESSLAIDYSSRAADAMRQWFGESSPVTASALANLAQVEERAHTLSAAAKHYEAAVRVLRHYEGVGPRLKKLIQQYADLLKSMHRDQEAKALDNEAKAFRSN